MRKLLFVLLFALPILTFNSCDNTKKDLVTNDFDYSLYDQRESLFSTLENINFNKTALKSGNSEFEDALNIINAKYGTDVYITEFDEFLIDNPNVSIDVMLEEGFITQQEYDVVNLFFSDLKSNSFENSIENLKASILAMNLNGEEFKKYNDFVNSLMIFNDYYSNQGVDIFSQNTLKSTSGDFSAGCAVALASNAVATVSLASCAVPGSWCAVAVVGKGLSMAGIYFSCF